MTHSPLNLGPASCGRCRHHVTLEGETTICRRYPPTMAVVLVPQRTLAGTAMVPQPVSGWPTVSPDQACGEFSPSFGIAN